MARPTTMKGKKFLLRLGDGQSPQTFAAPCAMNSRGLNFTASTNDFEVPDCDDEEAPVWVERVVKALSAGIPASGTLAMGSVATWRAWFLSGAQKDVQIWLDDDTYGGYFSCSTVLTTFNLTGNISELATIEVDIQSNGEVTWTDGAPA